MMIVVLLLICIQLLVVGVCDVCGWRFCHVTDLLACVDTVFGGVGVESVCVMALCCCCCFMVYDVICFDSCDNIVIACTDIGLF